MKGWKEDTKVPLSRFELPNANDDEKKTAGQLRKEALKEFDKYAKGLFALAKTYGIQRSRICQNCILINDWSYLGWIAAKGITENNISTQYSLDGELRDPNSSKVVQLANATNKGIRGVRPHIALFKQQVDFYKTANADKDYDRVADLVCKPLKLDYQYDDSDDIVECYNEVKDKCNTNFATGGKASDYCIKSMVTTLLKETLTKIVVGLDRARSGTSMRDFKFDKCLPKNTGYFEHMRHRKHTGVE